MERLREVARLLANDKFPAPEVYIPPLNRAITALSEQPAPAAIEETTSQPEHLEARADVDEDGERIDPDFPRTKNSELDLASDPTPAVPPEQARVIECPEPDCPYEWPDEAASGCPVHGPAHKPRRGDGP
jgi:hypothetical protein